MLATFPGAYAQTREVVDLAATLAEGARCDAADSASDLSANIAKVQPGAAEMVIDALTALGSGNAVCEPVRMAALSLAAGMQAPADPDADVRDAARALVDATLAEADRRAASLKFEVGPPPLNLSRVRKGGS